MSMQMVSFLALAAASSVWTANDPFVGTWKLDVSRSVIVDQMVVEAAGANKYTFRFEGGPAETVVADGTDQPGLPGTTLAVKAGNSHALKVVRKKDGRIIVSADWKLSDDGRNLRDSFTAAQSNGPSMTLDYVYKRVSGGSGFSGTWESTTKPVGLMFEQQIKPFGREGLAFVRQGAVKTIVFDGRDHATGSAGTMASGTRQSERSMQFKEKSGGKVIDTQALSLSPDGETLTIKVKRTGQSTPNLLVFARE